MIGESCYWKNELQKTAISLTRRCNHQKIWRSVSFSKVEQETMIGAFIVRRLIEAYKITTKLALNKIHLFAYRFNGSRIPDFYNWHNINKFYNFENKSNTTLPLRELCNQLMHSFIFMPVLDDNSVHLTALLFSSDRRRQAFLYEINMLNLIDIFLSVANNYPTKSTSTRDKNGQWEIINE